jgi:hypothetical protein
MYRRRGNPFPFIFFFLIFGGGFIFDLFFSLLPLIITGFIGYNIYKAIINSKPLNNKEFENKTVKSKYSERDFKKINRKLKEYFINNESLPIYGDIVLKPKKGTYTSVNQLYLYKNNEAIESLNEYGTNNREIYEALISMLLEFSKHKASNVKDTDIDKYVSITEDKLEKDAKSSRLSDARAYIEKIDRANELIPNEEITNGLYETTSLLKHTEMIEKSKHNPDSNLFHKLYDIYLPQLVKIIDKYKNLQDTNKESAEFAKSQGQLIKSVILVNQAIKNINETLQEEDYLDLSTDMTTLETLLKKDGLVNETNIRKFGGND